MDGTPGEEEREEGEIVEGDGEGDDNDDDGDKKDEELQEQLGASAGRVKNLAAAFEASATSSPSK